MYRKILFFCAFGMATLFSTFANAQVETQWDGWMHPGIGWGGMMFGGLMMVSFWGLVIFLIVLVLRGGRGETSGYRDVQHSQNASEIAKERLARGEIDHEAYDAIMHKIGN